MFYLKYNSEKEFIFFLQFQLSNLQQQRIMVEQLRREAAIKRVNVSQAIEDIKVPIWESLIGKK